MHTMIGLVALLTSLSSSNIQQTPTWAEGYSTAKVAVATAHKPMAVFFGSGASGWEKVLKDGSFDPAINQLLASKYICLYADVSTIDGYNLAKTFEVGGKGLVISDSTGKNQAFSLSGELTKAELKDKLEVYSKADAKITTTETVVRATAVTPVPAGVTTQVVVPAAYATPAPVYQFPVGGYYQTGGSCPNGNCPNRR